MSRPTGPEAERLDALARYDFFAPERDPDLQDLARLAAEICGTPMALVNFVDAERQVTRASVGIGAADAPREHSFCAHAMQRADVMVVEDARLDPRFTANPFVTGDPHLVFYAGAPLASPDGHPLGALCVLDREPRRLDERQALALRVLARQVVTQLELRRLLRRQARELSEGRRSEAALQHERTELEAQLRLRNSDLERANRELRRERGMLEALLDNVEAAIVACDAEGRLTLFNRTATEFHGLPQEPLPPERWPEHYDLYLADGLTRMHLEQIPLFRALRGETVRALEMVIKPKALPARTLLASGQRMTDADGRTLGAVVAMHDITELKRQREARNQTEKLAAMGQLLAGVAHELNNPLAVALGQAQLLRRKLGDVPDAARLQKIETAVERCARIVRNFLALARQQPPERKRVLLRDTLEQAAELIGYPLRSDGIELSLEHAAELPPVWADAHQLQQVLINLLTNAHHALRGHGGPKRIAVRTGFDAASERVRLEVEDNGPGIPEADKARVFEPFFTTKPEGQGTGLGLSLCKGIVESHGGSLSIEGAAGAGTLFRIELPTGSVEEPRPALRPAAVPPPTLSAAILVVDDEAEVRELLAELLEADGHSVAAAANGVEALRQLAARPFDLVISDLRMPLLDGPALYREAVAAAPELASRFVFMTGDALTPDSRDFLAAAPAQYLAKPFDVAEARHLIARLLGERGPAAVAGADR